MRVFEVAGAESLGAQSKVQVGKVDSRKIGRAAWGNVGRF